MCTTRATRQRTPITGSLVGNHGFHWNIAPQWIRSDNTIQIDNGTNSSVTDGTLGVRCLYRTALFVQRNAGAISRLGLARWSRSRRKTRCRTFSRLLRGRCRVDGRTCSYASDNARCDDVPGLGALRFRSHGDGPVNPIRIDVTSNQFRLWFHDTVTTNNVTITSHNVSDFAGEMITIVASRNNTTISFYVIGENKTTTPVTIVTANTGNDDRLGAKRPVRLSAAA